MLAGSVKTCCTMLMGFVNTLVVCQGDPLKVDAILMGSGIEYTAKTELTDSIQQRIINVDEIGKAHWSKTPIIARILPLPWFDVQC